MEYICCREKVEGGGFQCDGCKYWFHCLCECVTEEEKELFDEFYCVSCKHQHGKHNVVSNRVRNALLNNKKKIIQNIEEDHDKEEEEEEDKGELEVVKKELEKYKCLYMECINGRDERVVSNDTIEFERKIANSYENIINNAIKSFFVEKKLRDDELLH